jgi:hypothetical protein
MALAVEDHNLGKIKRGHTLQTGNVDAELIRIRAPLVVRVNAAGRYRNGVRPSWC